MPPRLHRIRLASLGLLLAMAAGCSSSTTAPSTSVGTYTSTDLSLGTGQQALAGNHVTVSYAGWLYDTSKTEGKGTQFDASSSFGFTLGSGQVISGWDRGVAGMRVGGQRRLILPPDLAYGSAGAGSAIPPNASLVFDITLKSIP